VIQKKPGTVAGFFYGLWGHPQVIFLLSSPYSVTPRIWPIFLHQVSRVSLYLFQSAVGKAESWTLSKIHLFSLSHGYWFWVIGWEPNGKSIGDGLSIPVLMSGEPIVGTLGP
jgi:hypothetical protein